MIFTIKLCKTAYTIAESIKNKQKHVFLMHIYLIHIREKCILQKVTEITLSPVLSHEI